MATILINKLFRLAARRIRALAAAAAVMSLVASGAVPLRAATPDSGAAGPAPSLAEILRSGPEGLTPEQADAIIAVLDDTQARQALRAALTLLSGAEALPAAPAEPPLFSRLRSNLEASLSSVGTIGDTTAAAIARDQAAGYASGPVAVGLVTLVLLLIGAAVGGAVRLGLSGAEERAAGHFAARMSSAGPLARSGIALAADFIAIATFAVSMTSAFLLFAPRNPRAGLLFGDVLLLTGAALILLALGRFVLAPGHPERRWCPLADDTARRVARALVTLLLASLVLLLPLVYARFLGLPEAPLTLARLLISSGVTLLAVVLTWLCRRDLATLALGEAGRGAPALLAASAVTAYLLLVWLLWSSTQLLSGARLTVPSLVSMGLVIAVPLLVRALLSLMPTSLPSERGRVAVAWTVSLGVGLWLLLAVWGLEPAASAAETHPTMRAVFRAGTMILIGLIGWLVIRGWLDRKIAQIAEHAAVEPGAQSQAKRLATILPLIRVFGLSVIGTLVVLSVFSAIGFDIAPLLAGAGVVGLAIGFGAQSLVSDVVSGIFFLMDDAFRVGEYVEIGDTRGTVEGISLRSLRLRHHMGAVHTLPFGQIRSLTNYSRDWAVMRLEFRVEPTTDLARLKKLVKQVGAELTADATLGPSFLEPLKSVGVRRVEEDALIIAVKFKARPGTQFTIRKEAYQRLIAVFRENGINLVAKGVTVRLDAGESAATTDQRQIGAAAARAVAESEAAAAKGHE